MDFQKLKQWGNEEYACECGLISKKKNKKTHQQSELCKTLMKLNLGPVRGTDYVKCPKCGVKKCVSGISVHINSCN